MVFCGEGPLSVNVTSDEIYSRIRLLRDNTSLNFFYYILPGQCYGREKLRHQRSKVPEDVLEASKQDL